MTSQDIGNRDLLEQLMDKSPAEAAALMGRWEHVGTGSYGVSPAEAEALRNGAPYALTDQDMNKLGEAAFFGTISGNENSNPLIIKMLAKGFIASNPEWERESAKAAQWVADQIAKYGPGNYDRGYKNGVLATRWILTPDGMAFARKFI